MSLYYVQKLLYDFNRDATRRRRYFEALEGLLDEYDLTPEERQALRDRDIGLLYVLGVNGQLLMHTSGYFGMDHIAYREAMRAGVRKHGPVRAGLYALVGPA